MTVEPFFADAIDLPLVLFYGLAVLIPLMAFQVAVEGGVLSRAWRIPLKALAKPVFLANGWSLLAGIPTKIFNAWIYSWLLPNDLAGYFARYPFAVTVGTLAYFVVTVLVESVNLSRWLKREDCVQARTRIWFAVFIANLATYAAIGPLHYVATRPIHDIREFTTDTQWARQPPTQIVYIDSTTGSLNSIFSDGSKPTTLVPMPVKDYLVTSNLDAILFHAPTGDRHLYYTDTGQLALAEANQVQSFATQAAFGSSEEQRWGGPIQLRDWKAWVIPGLGNQLRVYRTNDVQGSLVRVAINPGLLHLSDFRFALNNPALVSEGRECLFEAGDAIYLLDVNQRRVGKVTNGRDFIVFTDRYRMLP